MKGLGICKSAWGVPSKLGESKLHRGIWLWL